MRLLSAQIQNYRAHQDCTIAFKDSLVLIHGPNESGKSTLAEAIHCALFLKAKGSTELHSAMESDHGGEPSVLLEFEAKGTKHTLEKTFGAKGSTILESQGEATLTGDAAETQLATLLGVDGAVGGRGAAGALPKRWAHLWVWQGQSNRSPVETIEESETQLREKLQARTGQDVISSPLDGRVIEQLQAIVADSTTSTGRVKAGSDLDKADKALEAARTQLADKQAQLLELNQAATAYEQASQDL
jgi:DNA repair exonuclease SbcCD ATPase subunit